MSRHKCDDKCLGWWARRRRQRECWHHGFHSVTGDVESWIASKLIEMGRAKMFWCEEDLGGCGKVWIT